jgi:hypothetical protein
MDLLAIAKNIADSSERQALRSEVPVVSGGVNPRLNGAS